MANIKARTFSYVLLTVILFDLFRPYTLQAAPVVTALSQGGPVAASAADYVDPFTGDFHYSVPLLSVPGPNGENVPVTASYNAGIRMNQSASWIGLGWDFNPGEISRQVNGVPDDNNGKVNFNASCDPSVVVGGSVDETSIYGPMYNDISGTGNFSITPGLSHIGTSNVFDVLSKKYYSHDVYRNVSNRISYNGYYGQSNGSVYIPFVSQDYDSYRVSGAFIGGSLEPYTNGAVTLKYEKETLIQLTTSGDDIKPMQFNFEKSADISSTTIETTNNRIKTGYFVKYFTNSDINDDVNGFIDYRVVNSGDRRDTADFEGDGIGGYQITTPNGITYHYALPVYTEDEQVVTFGLLDSAVNFTHRVATINRKRYKYATSWKLTAITGSDYIDNGNHYADSLDKGYWVAYDYTKWCDEFDWASPMYGYKKDMQHKQWPKFISTGGAAYKQTGVVTSGISQSYYLNKIRTATHTALFVKSIRKDEQSMDHLRNPANSAVPQLKLDKIILLRNEDLGVLGNTQSIPSVSGFTTSACDPDNDLIHMGDYTYYESAIKNAALKIVEFNYDYSLCRKYHGNITNSITSSALNFDHSNENIDTFFFRVNNRGLNIGYTPPSSVTNSDNDQSGKLTLKKIEVLENTGVKIFPSYDFEYSSNNPDYNHNKTDIWGYYKSDYIENKRSYYTTPVSKDSVDAWSLKEITTPLGGKIQVNYESDEYVGEGTKSRKPFFIFLADAKSGINPVFTKEPDSDAYDSIVAATTSWPAMSSGCLGLGLFHYGYVNGVSFIYPDLTGCTPISYSYNPTNTASALTEWGWAKYSYPLAYGGGLRVKDIVIEDPETNEDYKLEYTYENGLCTFKPDKFKEENYTLTSNLPQTDRDNGGSLVGYEKCSVKTISNNNHDNGKTQFEFNTNFSFTYVTSEFSHIPVKSETYVTGAYRDGCIYTVGSETIYDCRAKYRKINYGFNLTKNVGVFGEFGKLKKKSIFDSNGALLSYTNNYYKTVNETTERVKGYEQTDTLREVFQEKVCSNPMQIPIFTHVNQVKLECDTSAILTGVSYETYTNTTIFSVASNYVTRQFSVPYKTETYANGITTTSIINERDPVSMQPLSSTVIDPTQGAITTTIKPAYTNTVSYSAMGMKSACSTCETNENMVSLVEEQRVIKQPVFRNTDGVLTYNPASPGILMGASKQTYEDTVVMRRYNNTESKYESVSQPANTWLPYESYTALTTASTPSSTSTPEWKKTNTITVYNTLNKALETEGMSGRKSAVRYGYNNLYPLCSISDANYNCFAFSSFEDKINVNPSGTAVWHFGGEVTGGIYQSAATSAVTPHTGTYVAAVPVNTFGPGVVLNGFEKGRSYRASVWIHKSASNAAALCMACDGSISGTPTLIWQSVNKNNSANITVGDWILMSVQLDVPGNFVESGGTGGNNFSVFVWNGSSATTTAYYDDLVVRPVDAPVTGTVYDPKTARVIATLDNENFASYFEYDAAGRVTATYKETKLGVKKISETQYNFSRQ